MTKAPAMKPILAALLLLPLAGCNVYRDATAARPDPTAPWRAITTDPDRERLRTWHKAWDTALPLAREADAGAVAAEGLLFDPDRALPGAALPVGKYRCRTFKLGADGTAMRDFTAYPAAECAVVRDGDVESFHIFTGIQRPTGLIYRDSESRSIFLGTMILGDETSPLRYGLDPRRDMVGYIERVGESRWRLVLPYPSFESTIDVIELVPA